MAKRTDKSSYPSIYGGNECFVTPAQYIVELVCQKQSSYENHQLPLKFWNMNNKWANIYKRWLRQTHKLLKEYDSIAIIRALKKSGCRWSLHTDYMINLIKKEQLLYEKEQQNPPSLPEHPEKSLTQEENVAILTRSTKLPQKLQQLDL